MNLQIGKIRRYNNKILIASPSFKIGTNLKINLDEQKGKPDVKSNKEHKQDTKHDIKINKEHKQDVKPNIEFKQHVKKPDTNKITYEEEKVALVLGMTSIFTVLWMFKCLQLSVKNSHLGQNLTWLISSSSDINQ